MPWCGHFSWSLLATFPLGSLGWDYVLEIDSRIGFRRESTIEISLRLSSQLFGLQNCDYICLNEEKCAKKSRERKKSERIFPAIQIYFPGGREIASSRPPGKYRPDSWEEFLCSLRCDNNILRPLHHPFLRQSPWTPFLTTFLIPLVAPSRTRTSVLRSSRMIDRRFAIQLFRLSKVFAG